MNTGSGLGDDFTPNTDKLKLGIVKLFNKMDSEFDYGGQSGPNLPQTATFTPKS